MASILPSKREFLSQNTNPKTGKPFAVFPGRGRFSAEAEAFALANADKFTDAAPAPVKAPRAASVKKADKPETLAEAQATGQRAPSPLDMPRRRPENTGFSVVGNMLVRQEKCGCCNVPIGKTPHAPRAISAIERDAGEKVILTLDKPVV